MLQAPAARLRIGGADVALPNHKPGDPPRALVFAQQGKSWKFVGVREEVTLSGKRPAVQGPIDDAFAAPFLCVRGTGQPFSASSSHESRRT